MTDFAYSDTLPNEEERQRALVGQQQEASQQPVPSQNPFDLAMQKYGGVNIPDTPVAYGGNMAEALLNDNEVPAKFKENFWFVFHKDNTLTFLDEERKRSKLLNFDIIRIDMINTMPYYDFDFDFEMKLNMLRNIFETKLDRALGRKSTGQINERTALTSQFQEQRMITQNDNSTIKEGFFKRLLGRRG